MDIQPPPPITLFELQRGPRPDTFGRRPVVAQCAVFPSGKAVLAWLGAHASIAVYDSIEDLVAVHVHHGDDLVQVARLDFAAIDHMQLNRAQDDIEGAGNDARPGTNAGYFWDERDRLLDMLRRIPLAPRPS